MITCRKILQLQKDHAVNESIFRMHIIIDAAFRHGRFEEIDNILKNIDISQCNIDTLITLLTCSKIAEHKLPSRTAFFHLAEKAIIDRGEMEPYLLEGLLPSKEQKDE